MSRALRFALVLLTACAPTLTTPRLPPPPATSLAQFLAEGTAQRNRALVGGVNTTATFSLPTQTLAALLMVAAQRAGWTVDPVAGRQRDRWTVALLAPQARRVTLYPTAGGGSYLYTGAGGAQLPAVLYGPLRDTVRAYFEHQLPPAAFTPH